MQTPEHDDDAVAKLRQQLQCLEQENDDLQSYVRRLKATEEDLSHRIERAEEEVVFAQQELEYFKEEHVISPAAQINELRGNLQRYKTVVSRLLSVVDIPDVMPDDPAFCSHVETDELELVTHRHRNTDDVVEASAGRHDDQYCAPHDGSDQAWANVVDNLRSEVRTKNEQLQAVERDYEEFMVASYKVEKALASETTNLKHSIAALQTENARLQYLLVTKRNS
ncbi:unnamed protein product [Hyaloperonospora brassicae]|uniref:Uncharacterized protein n=1 Tax=Hyaloperonospora brassicae TaxID=162125 RepID=A0AAV0TD51_HYABA|nr:unnamed protein product [Hyaloperonospora brassicae]